MSNDTDVACVATAIALCLNMSSDTDAACVATALALCLNMSSDTDAALCGHCFSPLHRHIK
jgi:hypothetical protein